MHTYIQPGKEKSLQNDIILDLLTQLSNLCNCSLTNRDKITPLSLQCDEASDQYTDEILLRAVVSISSRAELLNSLQLWIIGTSPSVTVSDLGIQLLLDRSCPLYTTSDTSNECLDPTTKPATVIITESSSNGGAIAGALIGGILLGVILTVGVGSVIILLLLWWKKRGGDNKKVQMMKKVDPKSVGTTLATRYVPSTENLHQESTEAGYEPIAAYIKDGSGDRRAANAYEEETTKQKKQRKKNSNKDSDKKVMEDESGYVVPDSLWEGKQRPVAPGSATSAQKTGKTSKPDAPSAPETTTKVEYDVPEGIEHRDANLNKVKGQRVPQSAQHIPTNTISQKEHVQPQHQQTLTGKDHQKQKLQAKEPPKMTRQPTELSQNNELKKSTARTVLQDDKPAKKNKPISYQKKENSSKLAVQYHESDTSTSTFGKSGAVPTSKAAPQQDHTAVKSKLQNLLTPAASSQPTTTTKPTHAKLSKQPGASATESSSGKVQHQQPQAQQKQQKQESQPASKVMAMAQKLQGAVGQASAKAPGPETTDSKSPGAKKKYVLHVHACTCMV